MVTYVILKIYSKNLKKLNHLFLCLYSVYVGVIILFPLLLAGWMWLFVCFLIIIFNLY